MGLPGPKSAPPGTPILCRWISARFPGAGQALIQVIVSDGVNSGTATSPAFTVNKKTPTIVGIDNPVNGAAQAAADPVLLMGHRLRSRRRHSVRAALAWSSNLQGALGTGSPLSVTLQPGSHTITLTATDSDGNSISATATITIAGRVHREYFGHRRRQCAYQLRKIPQLTPRPAPDGAPLSSVQVSLDGAGHIVPFRCFAALHFHRPREGTLPRGWRGRTTAPDNRAPWT